MKNKNYQTFDLEFFPPIKLRNVLCYKKTEICLIVAIKEEDNPDDRVYFGVDRIGNIHYGIRSDWSSIMHNLELLHFYANKQYVLKYSKEAVMKSIARIYSKSRDAVFKKVPDAKNTYKLFI